MYFLGTSLFLIFVIFSQPQASECSIPQDNSCTDLTRVPETNGSSVVLACVRLIEKSKIFQNDYQTLRRIAFVETADGIKQSTYRPYYHGGIWAVNESVFLSTKTSDVAIRNQIQSFFSIDWSSVEWKDLRKPLYSALAARIYINKIGQDVDLSQVSSQASFWSATYNGAGESGTYINASNSLTNYQNVSISEHEIEFNISMTLTKDEWGYLQVSLTDDSLDSVIEIAVSVSMGQTLLYVSNLIIPSEAVSCAKINTTTDGRMYISPRNMNLLANKLYIGLLGTKDEINSFTVSISKIDLEVIQNMNTEANQFFIGMFSNHPDAGSVPISLLVTTSSSEPVNVIIESIDGELISGQVNSSQTAEFFLPDTFVVSNISDRHMGLLVKAENGKHISVSVSNHHYYSSDSYLALPLIKYSRVDQYTYYALTPEVNSTDLKSRILLVGGYNGTNVTITPTQSIYIPQDLSPIGQLLPSQSLTIQLNMFETLLLESESTLSGTKVVSNKPITFLSGHQCAVIPNTNGSCDFAIEQFPPTINWGKSFMFPVLASRPGGSHLSIMAAKENTAADIICSFANKTGDNISDSFTLTNPGDYTSISVAPDNVICSVVTDKPVQIVLLSTSEGTDDGNGDPLMMLVPPMEQYTTKTISFTAHKRDFENHYVNLVASGASSHILLDNELISSDWGTVVAKNGTVLGYAIQLNLTDTTHTISVSNNSTVVAAMMYGFNFSVGYGQIAGTKLFLTDGNYGPLKVNVDFGSGQVSVGQSIQLTCTTTGPPAYAIRWKQSSTLIMPSHKYSIVSNSLDTSVLTIYNASISDTGTYECVAYSYYTADIASKEDTVTVNQPPTLTPVIAKISTTSLKTSTLINVNKDIKFSISNAVPNVARNHIWWLFTNTQRKEQFLEPKNQAKYIFADDYLSITVTNPQLNDRGNYTLIAQNKAGVANLTVTFEVYVKAKLNRVPSQTKYLEQAGNSITFNCTADGFPRPEIIWKKDNQVLVDTSRLKIELFEDVNANRSMSIPGVLQSTGKLTIMDLRGSDNGSYSCRADNEANLGDEINKPLMLFVQSKPLVDHCLKSPCQNGGTCRSLTSTYVCICTEQYTGDNCQQSVRVTIPPSITINPKNTSGNFSSRVSLTCAADGSPQPYIQWYKNNVFLSSGKLGSSELVFSELKLSDRGFYHCMAWSLIDGINMTKTSMQAIINIDDIAQYQTIITLQNISDKNTVLEKLRNRLSDDTFPDGISYLNLEEQMESNGLNVSLVITLRSNQGPIEELRGIVEKQLASFSALSGVSITIVDVDRFDGCPSEETIIYSYQSGRPELNITLVWNETNIGELAIVTCPCGIKESSGAGRATRYCGGDFANGAKWSNAAVESCNITDFAREICRLTKLPVPERIEQLENLTSNTNLLQSDEVVASVTVLLTATEGVLENLTLTTTFLGVIDNILNVSQDILQDSQETSNTSAQILEALETVVENIPIKNSSEPEIIPLKSFAVAALLVDIKDIKVSGQNFSINSREITEDNLSFGTRTDNAVASISLPNTILYNVTDITNSTRITHSVFLFDSLFLRRSENYLEVGSIIISASIVGKTLRGLRDPVSLNFLINSNTNGSNPRCYFWNSSLDSGYGDWSTEGCIRVMYSNNRSTCECNHLTSFAILLDVQPTPPTDKPPVEHFLEAVTYIGIVISLICLIVTIISYLSNKKLRKSDPGQLLLNLCFALSGLYISFIFAVHSNGITWLCATSAVVLQYFFLVTFMVMAAEAINLYMSLVIVLGQKIHHFVLKATVLSWVVPLFIVLFCFAPSYKHYISDYFCRAFDTPFYIGTVIPFIIIYIFNWTMFVIIIISLIKKGALKADNNKTHTYIRHQIVVAVALSTLFGIGWGIGLFATSRAYKQKAVRDFFAALFVILTAFHGFFIFLMHCVRSTDVRKQWKRWLYRATGRNVLDFTSVAAGYTQKKMNIHGKPKDASYDSSTITKSTDNPVSSLKKPITSESSTDGNFDTLHYSVVEKAKSQGRSSGLMEGIVLEDFNKNSENHYEDIKKQSEEESSEHQYAKLKSQPDNENHYEKLQTSQSKHNGQAIQENQYDDIESFQPRKAETAFDNEVAVMYFDNNNKVNDNEDDDTQYQEVIEVKINPFSVQDDDYV